MSNQGVAVRVCSNFSCIFHHSSLTHTDLEDVLAWASLQTGQVRHYSWHSGVGLCVVHLPCYQRSYSHVPSLLHSFSTQFNMSMALAHFKGANAASVQDALTDLVKGAGIGMPIVELNCHSTHSNKTGHACLLFCSWKAGEDQKGEDLFL